MGTSPIQGAHGVLTVDICLNLQMWLIIYGHIRGQIQ
jgi:hypothetical protein